MQQSSDVSSSSSNEGTSTLVTPPSRRLRSLDCFRGLTILLMIFVNCGGGGYFFFNHSIWNGLTFADCVFPWFMFIMGVSITISMRSAARKTANKRTLMIGVTRRTILLFLFGLLVNSGGYSEFFVYFVFSLVDVEFFAESIRNLRLLSVLGRFSIAYFFVATWELLFSYRIEFAKVTTRLPYVRDIWPFWPTAIYSIIFPTAQLLFTFLLKVPGCPT